MQTSYDVIVIGGGPAGCAAATFASRCRWKTLMIDKGVSAGYLGSLGNVSYFPGFPESISGSDLIGRMRRQAELVGTTFSSDTVTSLVASENSFKITTSGGKELESKAIVVATGAAARTNYLQGEREFLGRGVYYDAFTYGPAVAKRTVAVIGKTRQAVEEAVLLTRFADHIHMIIPSSKLSANDALKTKLENNKSVEMHFSTSLKGIVGQDHVKSITVFTSGQEKEIPVTGVFSYVHDYTPTTTFLEKSADIAEDGSIRVDNNFSTSSNGIFACGDVLCGRPQLTAISSAQGLLAGIGADRYLSAIL
jgi:thioredoxin reductase (NADPH)